jgi:hypothetical protein
VKKPRYRIVATPWEPEPPEAKRLRPIGAAAFIRERDALAKLLDVGVLTAAEHADRYQVLLRRLKGK